ncbi:MAG TPA: hypothetical protein VN258_16630 [Mobilitalea sp.]|nr:hypothetical protein [Mobilitalea sp.]
MKRLVLCAIALLLMFGAVSCSKDKMIIKTDDISGNTFLAKANGQLQVATVEDFDKSYYKLSELEEFIKKQIDLYNQKSGKERVTINDIQEKDQKAIMILSYDTMESYSTFNDISAAYFNGGISEIALELPTTLINSKSNSLASTKEVLQNDKYKILVLNEPYNIIVDGSVKYYSEGASLTDNNEVQGAPEGMTIVVFK